MLRNTIYYPKPTVRYNEQLSGMICALNMYFSTFWHYLSKAPSETVTNVRMTLCTFLMERESVGCSGGEVLVAAVDMDLEQLSS